MVKVSVIIPVYNAEKYVKDALESVMAQSLTEIEILAVDDGSTDASSEILTEYALKSSKVRVIRQENSGLSAARNVGFSFATGKYVMYVDSDDWIDVETCNTAVSVAIQYGADVVF